MSNELLNELNAFRTAEGKAPFADWRKARHMPMLEAYRAAAEEEEAEGDEPDALIITESGEMVRESELPVEEPAHDFAEGEIIFDVDGNEYTVKANKAVLNVENTTVSYFLGRQMAQSFTRENPKAPKVETVAEATRNRDFADPAITEAIKAEKAPAYKVLARMSGPKSGVDKPVGFVHQFLTEHPTLTRKEAIAALVGYGVNYSTARTQYQKWFSARKG